MTAAAARFTPSRLIRDLRYYRWRRAMQREVDAGNLFINEYDPDEDEPGTLSWQMTTKGELLHHDRLLALFHRLTEIDPE